MGGVGGGGVLWCVVVEMNKWGVDVCSVSNFILCCELCWLLHLHGKGIRYQTFRFFVSSVSDRESM